MNGAIGYYVHHHGRGHRERAMAIATYAPDRFTLIGTGLADLPEPFLRLDLADDRAIDDETFAGADGGGERPDALHYAPFAHEGVRARNHAMVEWMMREKPAAIVVDVSVEAAMLARLCATPTIYVRLAGDRSDPAHLDAFRGARALLAPFHAELDDPGTADWVRAKTRYAPGLAGPGAVPLPQEDAVLVVAGAGGSCIDGNLLAAAASATPDLKWRVVGRIAAANAAPKNLTMLGWITDVGREIARAGVVVGAAGDGVLGAVAAAGRPYVCLPEPRPYGEQTAKARRLRALDAAIVLDRWPDASDWPDILGRARGLDTRRLYQLHEPKGAERAAAFLMEVADR
ncbi:hypothetical protein [Methylopila sp. M107]|uniref:hypothetical protein n=1 Tax=Methylopila sp. M107 TaxID=1101190 RepID=UPI00036E32A5|nr:hypothetical protein [Methylopila sp. M107]